MAELASDFAQSGTITIRAGYDVALLPAAAAERLRQLRQQANDLHAVIPEFAARQAANTARGDAERRLQRLLAHRSEGGFALRENDPQVLQARQELTKLTDEARRLAERYEQRSEEWQSASRALQAVETWLKDGGVPPGVVLQDHEGPKPTLNKNETITDAIERHRRRVRELKADAHRIQSSPYPSSYAKKQMRAQIGALAMSGAPNVANLIEHDRQIEWPTQMLRSEVHNTEVPSVAFAELHFVLPILAWLQKDALIAALDREIASEADDRSALTHEARQQQEAVVQGDLLNVERDESWFVWAAMAERLPAVHRPDCAPAAILGVQFLTAPRAVEARGSSPMHAAWDLRR
jgi:hypothetical protein